MTTKRSTGGSQVCRTKMRMSDLPVFLKKMHLPRGKRSAPHLLCVVAKQMCFPLSTYNQKTCFQSSWKVSKAALIWVCVPFIGCSLGGEVTQTNTAHKRWWWWFPPSNPQKPFYVHYKYVCMWAEGQTVKEVVVLLRISVALSPRVFATTEGHRVRQY